MAAATATPCVGHPQVYDVALYDDDVPPEARAEAVRKAAALCGGCPIAASCGARVTASTQPRELVLLPYDWMPPQREGRPDPEEPKRRTWSAERREAAVMAASIGRDYVRPGQRPAAWARMAAQLAGRGRSVEEIAEALCVSVDTARALLGEPAGPTVPEQREANTVRARKRRAKVAGTLSPDDPRHGKPDTYTNWGCRCGKCTAANTEACRPRMAARRARLRREAA